LLIMVVGKCLKLCWKVMKCSINGKAIAAFATFCTVLVYLAVGAAIFQAIEEKHEVEQRQDYESQLHALLEEVDDEFHEELKAPCHMVEVLQAEPNVTNTWTFAPTVIFCLTVVTTIGYGYMYPVTDEGRGFCIFFALVGIPLFMACLAVYAQHTANFIRWVCKKLRKLCGGQENDNEKVQQIVTLLFCIAVICIFSGYLSYKEDWSYFDSVYFTFISFTTIGFGDLYPASTDTLFYFLFVFFIILGLISLGTVIEAQTTNFSKFLNFISSTCECMCGKCITVEKDPESDEEEEPEKELKKPNGNVNGGTEVEAVC